jgi:hemoglobin
MEELIEQLCMLSGGPCEYTSNPMAVVHGGLNITEAQLNAGVEDLQEAMERLNLSESAQYRLLARLAPLRGVIIYR